MEPVLCSCFIDDEFENFAASIEKLFVLVLRMVG